MRTVVLQLQKDYEKMGKNKDVGDNKSLGVNNILAPCAQYCDYSVFCEIISLHNIEDCLL